MLVNRWSPRVRGRDICHARTKVHVRISRMRSNTGESPANSRGDFDKNLRLRHVLALTLFDRTSI